MSKARMKDRFVDPASMSLVKIQNKHFKMLDYSAGGFGIEVRDITDLAYYGSTDNEMSIYFQGMPMFATSNLRVAHITQLDERNWKVGVQLTGDTEKKIMTHMVTVGALRPHAQRDSDLEKGIPVE